MSLKKITICNKRELKKWLKNHTKYDAKPVYIRDGKICGFELTYIELDKKEIIEAMEGKQLFL